MSNNIRDSALYYLYRNFTWRVEIAKGKEVPECAKKAPKLEKRLHAAAEILRENPFWDVDKVGRRETNF